MGDSEFKEQIYNWQVANFAKKLIKRYEIDNYVNEIDKEKNEKNNESELVNVKIDNEISSIRQMLPEFRVDIKDEDDYENFSSHLDLINPNKTNRDLKQLSLEDFLKYDTRSYSTHLFDSLCEHHLFFHMFCKQSLFIPRYLRLFRGLVVVSLMFCLNAMLTTDETIEFIATIRSFTNVIYYF